MSTPDEIVKERLTSVHSIPDIERALDYLFFKQQLASLPLANGKLDLAFKSDGFYVRHLANSGSLILGEYSRSTGILWIEEGPWIEILDSKISELLSEREKFLKELQIDLYEELNKILPFFSN